MTDKHWYDQLVERLSKTYNDMIIIVDPDNLVSSDDLRNRLNQMYFIHHYKNDIELEKALYARDNKPVLIILSENRQMSYHIETQSERIEWSLTDVFPNIDTTILKEYPIHLLDIIYREYTSQTIPNGILDKDETRNLVREWVESGSKSIEINELIGTISDLLASEKPNWLNLAQYWGKLLYICDANDITIDEYSELDSAICEKFEAHILAHYKDQFFVTTHEGPVTINKVMEYIGHQNEEKNALICFDGMAFQEWYLIKEYLVQHGISGFKEHSLYALLPTLTHTSRRALYCGEKNIENLTYEDKGFRNYIIKHWKKFDPNAIQFYYNAKPEWNPDYVNYDNIGIIINIVDDSAHAEKYVDKSKRLMQKKLSIAINESTIYEIFQKLLDEGYRIFVGSDHGTIWCRGSGSRPNKNMEDEGARRAALYPNEALADDFVSQHNVHKYLKKDIFGSKVAVFPKHRDMFGKEGDCTISHGGLHIEEVIIPFVEVTNDRI